MCGFGGQIAVPRVLRQRCCRTDVALSMSALHYIMIIIRINIAGDGGISNRFRSVKTRENVNTASAVSSKFRAPVSKTRWRDEKRRHQSGFRQLLGRVFSAPNWSKR